MSSAAVRDVANVAPFPQINRAGTPLAFPHIGSSVLITAGRRECWGSHTGGAEGHRNHAVPFCLYRPFVPRSSACPPRLLRQPRGSDNRHWRREVLSFHRLTLNLLHDVEARDDLSKRRRPLPIVEPLATKVE